MFTNKVVIVTGASTGVGVSIATRLAKEGAKLCLTGRNKENLQATAEKCDQLSGLKPLIIIGELTNKEYLKNIIEMTIDMYGDLDILINNAGYMKSGTLEEATMEEYDLTFKVNVKAPLHLIKLATPYLSKTKGNIINISALAGIRSHPGILTYSMSKAALDQLTKCVALELASKGIRVNSINPGYTPSLKASDVEDSPMKEFTERYAKMVPLGRNCAHQDIVEAVIFLASEQSSFITGHLMIVDGGKGLCCSRPKLPKNS